MKKMAYKIFEKVKKGIKDKKDEVELELARRKEWKRIEREAYKTAYDSAKLSELRLKAKRDARKKVTSGSGWAKLAKGVAKVGQNMGSADLAGINTQRRKKKRNTGFL